MRTTVPRLGTREPRDANMKNDGPHKGRPEPCEEKPQNSQWEPVRLKR